MSDNQQTTATIRPSLSAAEMRLLATVAERYQEELGGATDENDQCAYVEQVVVRFDSGARAVLEWDDGCVCLVEMRHDDNGSTGDQA